MNWSTSFLTTSNHVSLSHCPIYLAPSLDNNVFCLRISQVQSISISNNCSESTFPTLHKLNDCELFTFHSPQLIYDDCRVLFLISIYTHTRTQCRHYRLLSQLINHILSISTSRLSAVANWAHLLLADKTILHDLFEQRVYIKNDQINAHYDS